MSRRSFLRSVIGAAALALPFDAAKASAKPQHGILPNAATSIEVFPLVIPPFDLATSNLSIAEDWLDLGLAAYPDEALINAKINDMSMVDPG